MQTLRTVLCAIACTFACTVERAIASTNDSLRTYHLEPIPVQAERPVPVTPLQELPGQTSWQELAPFQLDITNTANVLGQLPGLHLRHVGSLGHLVTATLRGASPSQVSIYLDGVPMTVGGSGVLNLAELPFAGIDHIEVYRGFAPAHLPAASMGGAINLVSASRAGWNKRSQVRLGAGSFGTRRFGFTHEQSAGTWALQVAADALQTEGDFDYLDNNGNPWETRDDEITRRRNNWLRSEEILARLQHSGRGLRWTLTNSWLRRKEGIAGIASYQSDHARAGLTRNISSIDVALPTAARGHLDSDFKLYYDWRRDTFADPHSDIGLGYQDNRDDSRAFGVQGNLQARVPWLQRLSLFGQVRQETFDPEREYPRNTPQASQSRTQVQASLEERWTTAHERLALHGTLRFARERDQFTNELRGIYSQGAAAADTRNFVEPYAGVRLRLIAGFAAEASYGEYHRTPSFLELFGDQGSVAGSTDLQPEEGINRDVGLEWSQRLGWLRARAEIAHFHNTAHQLIVFVPQSQRTFVARNVGGASLRGEEFTCDLQMGRDALFWRLQTNVTHLRSEDLGIDRTWYAGNQLPGRPQWQLFARLSGTWSRFDLGWQVDRIGSNTLDRANLYVVEHSARHDIDLTVRVRRLRLRAGVQNLTDERSVDVMDFPLPGRTFSFMSEWTL